MKSFTLTILFLFFSSIAFGGSLSVKMVLISNCLSLQINNHSGKWSYISSNIQGLPVAFLVISSKGKIIRDKRWFNPSNNSEYADPSSRYVLSIPPNDTILLCVPYFPQDRIFSIEKLGKYYVFGIFRDPVNSRKIIISNPGFFTLTSGRFSNPMELTQAEVPLTVMEALNSFLADQNK